MTTENKTFFARFCTAGLGRRAFAIFVILCTAALASAFAQETHIITFDAPGADTTPGDFNGTYAGSVNAAGAITGSYQDENSVYHGFLRSPNGKFTTFDEPDASSTPFNGTSPSVINDFGVIAGNYYDANGFSHGFLRSSDGKFTTFDAPDVGGYGTTPLAINLEGAVVGFYTDSNFSFHAFLRSPDGKFTTWIGQDACTGNGSEGCFGSGASNINLLGIVVGGYEDNSGNFVHHSFVRGLDGKLKPFDVPAAGTGSYQGTGCPGCALGFNLGGAVAGNYIDANSVQHGFLRNPNGTFTSFDVPGAGLSSGQGTGCPSDCPTSLNDFGAIVGTYIDTNYVLHGYLRSPNGKIVTVDPVGSIFTWSSSLNDFGAITGYYADANGVYHGFLAVPCDHCHENDDAASTSVSSVTTTTRVSSTFSRMLSPKLPLSPWYRRLGRQLSK